MRVHLAELVRVLEAICTAIGRILAFEIEMSASLAGRVSITFDLPPLAFIATKFQVSRSYCLRRRLRETASAVKS